MNSLYGSIQIVGRLANCSDDRESNEPSKTAQLRQQWREKLWCAFGVQRHGLITCRRGGHSEERARNCKQITRAVWSQPWPYLSSHGALHRFEISPGGRRAASGLMGGLSAITRRRAEACGGHVNVGARMGNRMRRRRTVKAGVSDEEP